MNGLRLTRITSCFANLLFLQQALRELSCCNSRCTACSGSSGVLVLQSCIKGVWSFHGIFCESWCHFNGVHWSWSWLSLMNSFHSNIKPVTTSQLIVLLCQQMMQQLLAEANKSTAGLASYSYCQCWMVPVLLFHLQPLQGKKMGVVYIYWWFIIYSNALLEHSWHGRFVLNVEK